jgi:outer membrane lipoprotein carrier protein
MAVTKRCSGFVRQLTVLVLLGTFACFGEANLDDLIQKVEKRYNGAQTLSVNFVENYSLLGHSRPPEAGALTLRKQGKMRWDYTQPKGKLFISDGKNVFLYTSRDNRVEKIPLKDTEDMRAPLAFLLGRLNMKKEFRDLEVRAEDGGTWLKGSSRDDRAPYSSVDMLIASDGSIRKLKIVGRDQSLIAFSFSDERLNPPAPNELFHFEVPPGAEVVDSVSVSSEEK